MKVYEMREPESLALRSHPWSGSAADPSHRYMDFVAQPELIRQSLEDFEPWRAYRSTETFFRLLEMLNGPDSVLMTNDCAFNGPAANTGGHSDKRFEVSCRVMVLFRDLDANTHVQAVPDLTQRIARALAPMEPGFDDGIVGVSMAPTAFTTLNPPREGRQLLLSLWSWGDHPFDAMDAMDRTMVCLSKALKLVATE